jgi:alpha-mannosidase
VQPGRVEQFFERLYERVWHNAALPTWSGELYLELHRGTYTSQAHAKQWNRDMELLYREAEWLNAWAATLGETSQQEDLDDGWKLLLLNQFHDILPGSSVQQVYADSRIDYQAMESLARGVCTEAVSVIVPGSWLRPAIDLDAPAQEVYVLNSLPWERADTVALELSKYITEPLQAFLPDGTALLTQTIRAGDIPMLLVDMPSVPSYGYQQCIVHAEVAPPAPSSLRVTEAMLENEWLRLELDDNGEIASLYDKEHEREIIAPSTTGNQLVAYEDRPLNWEAWDIDPFYVEKPYPVRELLDWRIVEQGPLRATIEITRQVGQSTIRQRICCWHHRRRIDFVTHVQWQERQTLLRVLFPLNMNATAATCEIQFGALERPTHHNTSWEAAQFEVCAHRWVDMGEGGYGVALLNTGKYGHSFDQHVLGLSLLKGATFPDPHADEGTHEFTYSLLPHANDWRQAQVVRHAYELNAPLQACATSEPPEDTACSFLSTPTDHIVVETVKVAEDGNGLIVRLYEAHNQRGAAALIFGQPVKMAAEVDMLEREVGPLDVEGQMVRFNIRPFEIKTLRVWLDV